MISVKIHREGGEIVLAACDEGLIGRTLVEGKKRFNVSNRFYGDRVIEEIEFIECMKDATIMNLIGETVVSLAIREGYVDEENIICIEGVRHAQAVRHKCSV